MSRLTRDGTAEPISRDQILRRLRGQGNIFFVQLTTNRIDNLTRFIHTLAICDDNTRVIIVVHKISNVSIQICSYFVLFHIITIIYCKTK